MLVAITGGRGFIGAILVKYHLQQGDEVRLLTRKAEVGLKTDAKNLEIHVADLTSSSDDLIRFVDGVDVLYHCAGEVKEPQLMYSTNVDGTKKLVAAATGRVGRWVQLSSVGVYGQHMNACITEESSPCPVGTYEESKMLSDLLVVEAGNKGSFPWFILRPTTVFGSSMTNQSLFQLLERVKRKQFFFIGKTGALVNYIHVNNVIAALTLCATTPLTHAGNIYNLSSDCSLEDFVGNISINLGVPTPRLRIPEFPVRIAAKILGKFPGFPLTISRVDALCRRTTYPIDKIQNDLGYQPVISLQDGIRELVVSWQENQ